MKFALFVLAAFLGAANATLKDDFQEIIALIPVDEIQAISAEYAANDPEFQYFLAYLESDKFKAILDAIASTEEFGNLVRYLEDAGLDLLGFVEKFWSVLGVSRAAYTTEIYERSFHGWWNEVSALIPTRELMGLIQQKLQTSPYFQEFAAQLRSDEFNAIVAAVYNSAEWQDLLQKGRDHGAPVDAWLEIVYAWFGWEKQ